MTENQIQSNPLYAPLHALVAALETVRDDQVSIGMKFGRTRAEQEDRRRFLASEVQANAEKIDDALAQAIHALEGNTPYLVAVNRDEVTDLLVQAHRASRAFNAAGLPAPSGLAVAAERLRNSLGISVSDLPK